MHGYYIHVMFPMLNPRSHISHEISFSSLSNLIPHEDKASIFYEKNSTPSKK